MKFDVPVRIRWDADPPSGLAEEKFGFKKVESIFRSILEASPLSLDITVMSPEVLNQLLGFPDMANVPVSVSLYLSEEIVHVREGEDSLLSRPDRVFFHGKNCAVVDEERFWFEPDPLDYGETFELIDAFLRSPGRALVLKNPNYRKRELPAKIPIPDFEALKNSVDGDGWRFGDDKKVVVHDYFLWKFFRDTLHGFSDERAEFDGCQGGSMLAYIDWGGVVYPCESLLVPLGALPGDTISDIWASPERMTISDRISEPPPDCFDCGELQGCFGGCRGLSHHIRGRMDLPDPQCDR